jgi:hypothetical protein
MRIEAFRFSSSSLQSILILPGDEIVDSFSFVNVTLSSISTESQNEYLVVENAVRLNIYQQTLIHGFANSSQVESRTDIEIHTSGCSAWCNSLSSISFESNSRLAGSKSSVSFYSSLPSIVIPFAVQILCPGCFLSPRSLSSSAINKTAAEMTSRRFNFTNASDCVSVSLRSEEN